MPSISICSCPRIPGTAAALLARNPRAEQIGPAAAPALDNTPAYMLLSRGTESLQTLRWRRESRANPSLFANSLLAANLQGISLDSATLWHFRCPKTYASPSPYGANSLGHRSREFLRRSREFNRAIRERCGGIRDLALSIAISWYLRFFFCHLMKSRWLVLIKCGCPTLATNIGYKLSARIDRCEIGSGVEGWSSGPRSTSPQPNGATTTRKLRGRHEVAAE